MKQSRHLGYLARAIPGANKLKKLDSMGTNLHSVARCVDWIKNAGQAQYHRETHKSLDVK